MLLVAALVFTLNAITVFRVEHVSAVDEQYWIDHLLRGADFGVERAGVSILQETVREKCERGMDFPAVPPCTAGHLDARKYGFWHGVNIAGRPPFYFLITGPIARVLRASPVDLPPNDSLVTWARLLGTAWLLVGLYCLLRIGEILRVNRWMLAVAMIFISATPAMLHANTIVNTDTTAFPAGAAVLLAALVWERTGKRLWLLASVAVFWSAFAAKNSVGVVLVLAYFALRLAARQLHDGDDETRTRREYVIAIVVLVAAIIIANTGWEHLYSWLLTHVLPAVHQADVSNNPSVIAYGNRSIGLWDLFGRDNLFAMFPPFEESGIPVQRFYPLYRTMAKAAELVAIGALVGSALRDKLNDKVAVLTFATVITLLVSPPFTILRNQIVGGTYDAPIARYGLAALAGIAIALAAAMRTRFARFGVIGVTSVLYLSAIYAVIH